MFCKGGVGHQSHYIYVIDWFYCLCKAYRFLQWLLCGYWEAIEWLLNGCWVVVATFSAFVLLALRRALSFDLHVGGRFRSTCFEVVCFRSTCFEVGLSALSVEWLQQPAKLNWGFCEAVPPYPPVSMLTGIVPERVSKKSGPHQHWDRGVWGAT